VDNQAAVETPAIEPASFDHPTGRDLRRIADAIGADQFKRGLLFGLGFCVSAVVFFFIVWLVAFLVGALAWITLLSQTATS